MCEGQHLLIAASPHHDHILVGNEGAVAMIFSRIITLQKPINVAIWPGDEAVQADGDENMCSGPSGPPN